ncbi:MAG: DUF1080 domain-containing protein [Vicinamibacteria bacterium]|nr:DUF1080 domain-containing protein [Vicinamibacteria bacterium]
MSVRAFAAVVALVTLSFVPTRAGSPLADPPAGFAALFNGHDVTGWYGLPQIDPARVAAMRADERAQKRAADDVEFRKHWSVESGELVNDGNGPFATTDRDYGDIELRLEYRTVAKADSGVYLRGTPQVQIWDTTEAGGKWKNGADKGSGGLWNNSPGAAGKDPLTRADKPFGEWNTLRVVQAGERTWVWLNGALTVDGARMENFWDRTAPLPKTGPIQLQTHGGEIRWRNVFLRELPAAEVTTLLSSRIEDGFTSVFNGKDWTGWAGPVENYDIVDGAIVCKPKSGGTIFTKRAYADFVVRFEFKLPPAGNNGLAIRYPGEGDTAYVGMTELQVLDTEAPVYAKLDPRQAHGSAYGMAAARRGYLRPVGEWNFQEVTVRGSTIVVELNGTRVLDADLSAVTEFLDGKAHPGKDRKEGHFGFAGHNDPVAFRNVRIKPI